MFRLAPCFLLIGACATPPEGPEDLEDDHVDDCDLEIDYSWSLDAIPTGFAETPRDLFGALESPETLTVTLDDGRSEGLDIDIADPTSAQLRTWTGSDCPATRVSVAGDAEVTGAQDGLVGPFDSVSASFVPTGPHSLEAWTRASELRGSWHPDAPPPPEDVCENFSPDGVGVYIGLDLATWTGTVEVFEWWEGPSCNDEDWEGVEARYEWGTIALE